jgi:hypothetical protein
MKGLGEIWIHSRPIRLSNKNAEREKNQLKPGKIQRQTLKLLDAKEK